ncbi:hypothetical protein C8R47DRAFT_1213184 [Mycena vitilis]|nr:hypothetical protein C8R47DRAFT_1213184 [Mycena vitilis]
MNDQLHYSAPAASAVAGAGISSPFSSPPPSFQTAAASFHQAAAPATNADEDLDAALIAMNDAMESMAAATTAFFSAADLVNAGVAAVRASRGGSQAQAVLAAPPATHTQTGGPYYAGALYRVVPTVHLRSIRDNGEKWYAITRGKYVGLTKNSAVSLAAVTGISTALSEKHSNQSDALASFNAALDVQAVAVIQ